MKEFQFKTNIKCGGCVAKIAPSLDGNVAIIYWGVDTTNPKKILTVDTDALNEEEIKTIVRKAGFQAEKLS